MIQTRKGIKVYARLRRRKSILEVQLNIHLQVKEYDKENYTIHCKLLIRNLSKVQDFQDCSEVTLGKVEYVTEGARLHCCSYPVCREALFKNDARSAKVWGLGPAC